MTKKELLEYISNDYCYVLTKNEGFEGMNTFDYERCTKAFKYLLDVTIDYLKNN